MSGLWTSAWRPAMLWRMLHTMSVKDAILILLHLLLLVNWYQTGDCFRQTTPRGDGVTDDIIFSGAGSGCSTDDEDDCSHVGSGDADVLVTPILKVRTTPRPPTTTTGRPPPTPRNPTTTESRSHSGEGPCEDDEDCGGSGSGAFVEPVHTPKTYTDDIYLTSPEPTKRPSGNSWDSNWGLKPWEQNPQPAVKTTTDSMFIKPNLTETPPRKHSNIITRRPHPAATEESPSWNNNNNNHVNTGDNVPLGKEGEVNQEKPQAGGLGPLGLNIGLIVGIAAGLILLIVILAYALYKYKSRDEGSYKIDESKNYPYGVPTEHGKAPPSATNGGLSKSGTPSAKPAKKKDVKEWYV